jgi:DNA-binding winged helix-turn-helix (wHTH) protein
VSEVCPHCGRPYRERWPIVDLNTNTIRFSRRSVQVSPQAAEVMAALVKAEGAVVSSSKLANALWGMTEPPDSYTKIIDVKIHELRRKMAAHGFSIANSWGKGWFLQPRRTPTKKQDVAWMPGEILQQVVDQTGVSLAELKGAAQTRRVASARHLAMYRLATETGMTLGQIGQVLGHRDHKTVHYAVNKYAKIAEREGMPV